MGGRMLAVCAAVLIAMWAAPPDALAQASPETTAQLEALDQQLKSENRFVRLAALEAALASDNLIMRRMAFDAAFGGDDMEMKAYALRQFFQPEYRYPLELLPGESKEAQQRADELRGLEAKVEDYDAASGQIRLSLGRGAVALDELSVKDTTWNCDLTLKVSSPQYMQGVYRCEGKVGMPVRLRLN